MPRVPDLGIELAVGKGPGPALAELDVRFRVEGAFSPEPEGVGGALPHASAPFEEDRPEPRLGQDQAGEQAAGPGADHHRPVLQGGRGVCDKAVARVGRGPDAGVTGHAREDFGLPRSLHVQGVDEGDAVSLPGVDAAPEDGVAGQLMAGDGQLFENGVPDPAFGVVDGEPHFRDAQHASRSYAGSVPASARRMRSRNRAASGVPSAGDHGANSAAVRGV